MYYVTIYPSTTFNKGKSEIGHVDRNMPFSMCTEFELELGITKKLNPHLAEYLALKLHTTV